MVAPAQRHEVLTRLMHKGLSQRSICRSAPPGITCTALLAAQCRCRRVGVLAQLSFKRAGRLWKQQGFTVEPARLPRPHAVRRDERFQQATHRNHVWTYDILSDRLADGRLFKTLSILDEFTRECLAIYVAPSIRARDVLAVLRRTMQHHGHPQFLDTYLAASLKTRNKYNNIMSFRDIGCFIPDSFFQQEDMRERYAY